jgi:hypothetical protein
MVLIFYFYGPNITLLLANPSGHQIMEPMEPTAVVGQQRPRTCYKVYTTQNKVDIIFEIQCTIGLLPDQIYINLMPT